jgi:hypothetical protein
LDSAASGDMNNPLKNLDLSKDDLPANVATDVKNVDVKVDKIDVKVRFRDFVHNTYFSS